MEEPTCGGECVLGMILVTGQDRAFSALENMKLTL